MEPRHHLNRNHNFMKIRGFYKMCSCSVSDIAYAPTTDGADAI